MSKIYTLLIFCLLSFSVAAQTVSVSGQVTANDGETLPGVSVTVKGTTRGTVTDINGKYQLTNLQPKATLVFSFTGFQKVEQALNGQSTLDIQLKESTNELDEVVVTSFNIAKDKRELGYGSQTIKGDILKNTGDPNMVAAMQGKLAGVTINGSGGAPGAGTNIIIRGINSLSGGNDNQPLFIVDGIIISNNTFAGNALPSAGSNAVNSNEQFSNTNRAADMNPDDIESINVLKGAAATALYGQRASNGAIIITTKKGAAGKASITYSATYGVDNVDKVPAQQERYSHGLSAVPRAGFVFQQFGPLTQPGDPIF
ncbi:MAG: carboxypeptidase-like regulatory domain-containing protein, partial [Spirosomataceae bacterium]